MAGGGPLNPHALRDRASRRLPRFVFDFIDGAAGNESGLRRNRAALEAITLTPRALGGDKPPQTALTLFGHTYRAPIGIAPMGLAGLAGAGTDAALARAAAAIGIPHILSSAATVSMEDLHPIAGDLLWLQVYLGRDPAVAEDLMRRAERVGIHVLVVTVDTPVPGRRYRDMANGFTFPPRLRPRALFDMLRRPAWSLGMVTAGVPTFRNLAPSAPTANGGGSLAALMHQQSSPTDWDRIIEVRNRWKGALLLKGILHPDDAVRARDLGIDGIVVSNHGARQLSCLPAAPDALPLIRQAVGPSFPLLADGGVRDGEDVVRMLAQGADMALVGRSFLWARAAHGPEGPHRYGEVLNQDIRSAMVQLGIERMPLYPPGGDS